MKKIARPAHLMAELERIGSYVRESDAPERAVVATELRNLADRVAVRRGGNLVEHIESALDGVGDLVNHWQDERNDRLGRDAPDSLKKAFKDLKDAIDDSLASLRKAQQIAKSKIGVRG